MEIISYFFAFIGIVASCFLLFVGVGTLLVKRRKAKYGRFNSLNHKMQDIKDRLKKVKEITDNQMTMLSAIDAPQKNSLHGKYQNDLISSLKTLEQEKMTLLQSVLDDGYDPLISVLNSKGSTDKILLSAYLEQKGDTKQDDSKSNVSISQSKNSKPAKFFVIQGGKRDSDPVN